MPDWPTACPCLLLSPANEKRLGRPSWLNTRIDLPSPLLPILLFGGFSSLNRLWNSLLNVWGSASFFSPNVATISSFIYVSLPAVKSWDLFSSKRLLGCTLPPALMWQNQHKNTQSSEERIRLSDLLPHMVEGGCPGCIQSLTPMKWSTPWPIEEQDSGMVENNHAVKPPLSSQVC